MRTLIALITLLALSAQGMEMVNPDFDNLKNRLLGTWTFIEDNTSYEVRFEAVSHGNALLERNSGFIAVYHPDGPSIMMTLYTRDGNQPRFRAKELGRKSQSIRFVFLDITNWKSGTEHINGLEIVFKDRDHVIERWETLQPDRKKVIFDFELIRKIR